MRPSAWIRIALVLTIAGCGATKRAPLPRTPAADMPTIRPRDLLDVLAEPWLGGRFRVDDAGSIALPWCGRVVAAGSSRGELEERIAACLIDAEVLTRATFVQVMRVQRGSVRLVVGPGRTPREVPLPEGGIGLGHLLLDHLVLDRLEPALPPVVLERRGRRHVLTPAASERDRLEALEPGDTVVVERPHALRRLDASPRAAPFDVTPVDTSRASCGALFLELLGGRARAMGRAHPYHVALVASFDRRCAASDAVSASLPAACFDAGSARLELEREGLGVRHPRRVGVDAQLDFCATLPPSGAAGPPSTAVCAERRAARDAAISEGAGRDHPDVVAAEIFLAECP